MRGGLSVDALSWEVLLNKGHGKPVDWWTLGPIGEVVRLEAKKTQSNILQREFGVMRRGERPKDWNGGGEVTRFEEE